MWQPDKSGSYLINVLPYEVAAKNHPDKVDTGVLWYKYPFKVHHQLGADGKTAIVCPTSVGKPCPICQERENLAKDFDKNKEAITSSPLKVQYWVAYNILDPDDEDKVAVFPYSKAKFAAKLDEELKEGDEENLEFYDVTDAGKTLRVRFSDATYAGRKFLEATRIDFKNRDEMDEDEILGKTVCLDDMFDIMSYDKIKALFLQLEDEPSEKEEADNTGKRGKTSHEAKKKKDEEADEDTWKVGDRCITKINWADYAGEITDIDEDEEMASVTFDDGDEMDIPLDDLREEEEADEDEDEPVTFEKGDSVTWDEGAGEIIKLNSTGTKAYIEEDDETKVWVPVEELTNADDDSPSATIAFKKGDEVSWKKGKKSLTGTVDSVDGDTYTIIDDEGEEHEVDVEDILPFDVEAGDGKEESPPAATGKAGKKGKTTTLTCPVKGGKFGKDLDKHKECEDCPNWEKCEEASAA